MGAQNKHNNRAAHQRSFATRVAKQKAQERKRKAISAGNNKPHKSDNYRNWGSRRVN